VDVMDTAARLLRLLSLLQARPHWPGEELSERLGVTARTVRRDVTRLRSLGYPVQADLGTHGGYRLGAAGRLPPLLLEDEEAVAIAVGLGVAATTAVSGVADGAVAALAKLDQVLPSRLRERVSAVRASTVQLPGPELPPVDADVLVVLATGCRRTEGVRFGYLDHRGQVSERSVEPYRIVHTGRRWYLVARDRDRADWRTFRVDRVRGPVLTGLRYEHTDPPDAIAMVSEGTNLAPWSIRARLRVPFDLAEARRRFPPGVGVVEPDEPDEERGPTSVLRVAANELGPLVSFVAGLDCEVDVLAPPELRAAVSDHGARLAARHGDPPPG
jgi:predicted DNA-binding transcriptional regulator YafY